MNSPSRQCDLEPLEFPETQLAYVPPDWPLRMETAPPPLEPAHCSRTRGVPTEPFVHWLRLALSEVADAGPTLNRAATATTARNAARTRPVLVHICAEARMRALLECRVAMPLSSYC